MTEITSRKNRLILDALSLHEKKERDGRGLFFTEGKKLLGEALGVGVIPVRVFVTDGFLKANPDILRLECEIIKVTDEVYGKITDEHSPEGVFAIFEKMPISVSEDKSALLILEGIQDPGNMGTLLRCATAFGVRGVLTVSCADIYSPKTVRASMGAVFKMPCTAFENIDGAVAFARDMTDLVVATALHTDSVSIEEVDISHAAIMIGSEGRGLSDRAIELADKKIIIPIENIESLNASVAGAICMYTAMMKRKKK
ncbi:MAG: RNA methyltransferase [Ruminococcaceae bacterium]|nr:RNA methyltransferase [Oscillospiraceae bacterium]